MWMAMDGCSPIRELSDKLNHFSVVVVVATLRVGCTQLVDYSYARRAGRKLESG